MINEYFESKYNYIELLFNYFDEQNTDEYLSSHIAKYLTVTISGIFEEMVKKGIEEYLINTNICKEIKNYVNTNVGINFRNPNTPNLKGLLRNFSSEWAEKIKLVENESTEALDSIVNNKNLIAHGVNCTITYEEIKNYFFRSKSVFNELARILNTNSTITI
jgi:hypothetical protein